MRMEEVKQEQATQNAVDFNLMLQDMSKVLQKYNPPVDVAITAIFHIVSEVSQRSNIPKDNLVQGLSQIYDNVHEMLNTKTEEPANELQH